MSLDDSLNLNQILSISSIFRIIGRITRAKEPYKLFNDYLYLTSNLNKEQEKRKQVKEDLLLIETVISNLSKIVEKSQDKKLIVLNREELKLKIVKGDYKSVFESLIEVSKNENLSKYNNIITVYSQYNRLKLDLVDGIISVDEKELRLNKLSKSLISIIDDF